VPAGRFYDSSMGGLVMAIQDLATCQDMNDIRQAVVSAARQLALADRATFALRRGDECHYVDEDAATDLWTGRRSALSECASGAAISAGRAVVVPDVENDRVLDPSTYRATLIRSLAVVPIRRADPVGAIGVYWPEPHQPTDEVVGMLELLADSVAVTMENVTTRTSLELRLRDRWAELQIANDRLAEAVIERRMAEEEVRAQSLFDELTGLRNRRGFLVLAEQQLKVLKRSGQFGAVIFMDIDGLAEVNERDGHEAGDRLVATAAAALAATVRESDVVGRVGGGRVGGDEFAVLLACADPAVPELVVGRIQRNVDAAQVGLSIGVAVCEPEAPATLDELMATADTAMLRAKQVRRESTLGRR
jgi:diguanylate cyclase (GGDEF)-like protein